MEGHEVDLALTSASLEEGVEPINTHERTSTSTVGDSGRTDLHLTSKGIHVGDVQFRSGGRVHVGLRA